eukprot:scaffold116081_cov30-Tisochrysis_lutea.AAC.3
MRRRGSALSRSRRGSILSSAGEARNPAGRRMLSVEPRRAVCDSTAALSKGQTESIDGKLSECEARLARCPCHSLGSALERMGI